MTRIHDLGTPVEECIFVRVGLVDPEILTRLRQKQYDQAIVRDRSDEIIGLIETEGLQRLMESNIELSPADELFRCSSVNIDFEIHDLLRALARDRAVLVAHRSETSGESEYVGLITLSDVNRHPYRAMLYSLLVELETHLASFVENNFTEPWDWICTLDEDTQARVLGYWELAKRRNIDVGPLAATSLSQLLNIVKKGKHPTRLGYKSNSHYDDRTQAIRGLRNCVMHPVRPLILDQAGAASTAEVVESVIELTRKIAEANQQRQASVA